MVAVLAALITAGAVAARPGAARSAPSRSAAARSGGLGAALARGNATFAGRILALLGRSDSPIALSPYSISEDLGMVYAGARGQTATQMATALNYSLPAAQLASAFGTLDRSVAQINRPGATVDVANALYGQQGRAFRRRFLGLLSADYGAGLRTVDFSGDPAGALTEINGWVSAHTDGKIPSLLAPADVETSPPPQLVLVNAIYLDAKWLDQFQAGDTYDAPFAAPGGSVSVETMHENGFFGYRAESDFRVLELPYVGGRLAFDILLPPQGGLPSLRADLAHGGIGAAVAGLKRASVALSLPKFTLNTRFELAGALSSLGMPLAFSSGADLSGIAGPPGALTISKVVHEAYIEVNEEGTQAAGATGTVVAPTAVEAPPPVQFDVDRPFVFLLRDVRTGAVLFEGIVPNPAS